MDESPPVDKKLCRVLAFGYGNGEVFRGTKEECAKFCEKNPDVRLETVDWQSKRITAQNID